MSRFEDFRKRRGFLFSNQPITPFPVWLSRKLMFVSPLMKRSVRAVAACLLTLLLCLSLWSPRTTRAQFPATPAAAEVSARTHKSEFVPGEILVRFRPTGAGAKSQAKAALSVEAEGRSISVSVERFAGSDLVEGLRLARVQPDEMLKATAALRSRTDVLYAEPNFIMHTDAVPNDPQYSQMYSLNNTGQLGGTSGADISAEKAWNITTGSGNLSNKNKVVVGIVDTGVDISHEDLKDNIWTNPAEIPGNGIDDDGNGEIDDVNGWDFAHEDDTVFDSASSDSHGTHVAGTIGARGNNALGVTGINWDVKLMPLKFIVGGSGDTATAVNAFNYAKKMRELWNATGGAKGANLRVLNCSWGGGGSQALLDAINAVGSAGILVVAAAGNDASNTDSFPHYPSSYDAPNLISVASTDRNDALSGFSNFGQTTVQIAAPGSSILSTIPGNAYGGMSGTSMATPHVTGVAALLCAAFPNLTPQQLKSIIIFSGDSLPSLATKTLTGVRLNAFKALQAAAENDTTPPGNITDFHVVSQTGRTVTLGWTASGDDGTEGGPASLYELSFNDPSATNFQRILLTKMRPAAPGTIQGANVTIPYRHPTGVITLQAFDNVGNVSAPATINISINPQIDDPYTISLSPALPLSAGGTPLGLNADDRYSENYPLPFAFLFFGQNYSAVTISTNGALYFSAPPKRTNGDANDAESSAVGLNSQKMVAGVWDDLRTDRAGNDVFVLKPDADRIIFRWQATTFNTPLSGGATRGENPVNFEIELRRDGRIQIRYGDGNNNLFPVVGASGGEPSAYVVDTHTSEFTQKSLTNAQTVTFSAPIDDPGFFVAQHYLDFLNREPDSGGLAYWTDQIIQCGADLDCVNQHRINVSAAYFIETEFQQTGYYVYRIYKASSGRRPNFTEFMADRPLVTAGPQLEQSKQQFADAWVQRPAFLQAYPSTLSAAQFVNQLYDTANLKPYLTERQSQISAMQSGKTRAQVLRDVVETKEFSDREYNRAFVVMQYFGYLRREPEPEGEAFWFDVLNNREVGNYRGMVCSFITSAEYQLRFGSLVTRSNQDCK